jgi:3-hydroxyacyl-CoA dehydrogenase
MNIEKVAIIGAGAMGAGIAQVMAAASKRVVLIDVAEKFVESGLKRIGAGFASEVKKGRRSPEEKERLMALITGSTDQHQAAGADLIIEAIIEDRKAKAGLFQNLHKVCNPRTIFATNTSTLSVTELAVSSGRPGKFIGLHFFNPVPAMKLVEVIPGLDTDPDVVDATVPFMKEIKKEPVLVQDCPGFLVNRILLSYMNEVVLTVEEGVPPQVIDEEVKGIGFPMGPLELSDMVGWDVSLHTFPILRRAYGDRFPELKLVQKLNDAGRLGLKSGRGVYSNNQVDLEFESMVASLGCERNAHSFTVDRLILKQINEAVYCLQEGVATAEDIDRSMVLGTGFPNKGGIGGPLHWADEKGLDWVLVALDNLAATEGSRFWPHHLLRTYVAAERLGRKTGRGFFTY